jgi:hypothetical protein
MNMENKHTGPQFDNFGNKVEAKAQSVVEAGWDPAPPGPLLNKYIKVFRDTEALLEKQMRLIRDIEMDLQMDYDIYTHVGYNELSDLQAKVKRLTRSAANDAMSLKQAYK